MEYTFKVIGRYPKVKKGTIVSVEMKVAEYDAFAKSYEGILERYFERPPAVVFDGKAFLSDIQSRQPDGFKDVLSKIGAAHPISPLADRYHKKTIKEGQTRAVVDKFKKNMKKERQAIISKRRSKLW